MPGSPATPLATNTRFALVVATGAYSDAGLRRLRAPARDAADLADVLAAPDIGGFTVTTVTDQSAQQIRLAIEDFLYGRGTGDLLLVYLSCHGLLDDYRRLYFAATDTRKDRLAATGVEAAWVLDQLEHCRARRQVLILDSCFSGAFAQSAKGDSDLGLGDRFQGEGRGRVVLTASTATEYSFEGEPAAGSLASGSVFTAALVQGLRTGEADSDHDGLVSVDEAYAYVFDQVQAVGAAQTPQRWLYGAEGRIVLARSPARPHAIPEPPPEPPPRLPVSLRLSTRAVDFGRIRVGADPEVRYVRVVSGQELDLQVVSAPEWIRVHHTGDALTLRSFPNRSGQLVGDVMIDSPGGGARIHVTASADPAHGYPYGSRLATWWQRVGAAALDWLLLVPGFAIVGLAAGRGWLEDVGTSVWIVAWLFNRVYLQGRFGRSLGKRVLGLDLVRLSDGEPVGWWRAALRDGAHSLDFLIVYLGFLLPLRDARHQTLADKVMRTIVVSTRR